MVSSKVEVRTSPLYSSMDMGQAMVNLRASLDEGVGDHRAPVGQRASAPARLWFEPFLFFEQFNSVRYSTIQTLLVCAAAMILVAIVLLPSLPVVLLVGAMLVSIDVGVLGGMAMWGGEGIDLNSVTAINLCLGLGISLDMVSHPAEGFYQAWGNEWTGPFMLRRKHHVSGGEGQAKRGAVGGAEGPNGNNTVNDQGTNGSFSTIGDEGQSDENGATLAPSEHAEVDQGGSAVRARSAAAVARPAVEAVENAAPYYVISGDEDGDRPTGVGKPLPCLNAGRGEMCGLAGAVERTLNIPETWVWGGAEPRARVIVSLVSLGRPVLYGGLSSLLGVALLSGSTSYIFRCFFVCLFLVLSVGLFHALLVIPVLLSLIGGKRERH